jgi:hypothetical protein
MKYLKEYNQWYRDSSPEETIHKKHVDFTQEEYDKLLWLFSDIGMYIEFDYWVESIIYVKNEDRDGKDLYRIFKVEDDWYYLVGYFGGEISYYRCDEFQGLLECIKDKIINK